MRLLTAERREVLDFFILDLSVGTGRARRQTDGALDEVCFHLLSLFWRTLPSVLNDLSLEAHRPIARQDVYTAIRPWLGIERCVRPR
jgi:hypothetical protein